MAVDLSQGATALLTEHLQYTPLSLIDDIIDSVNNFLYQGVGSLETGLLSTPAERLGFKPTKSQDAGDDEVDYPEAKQEIEEGLHKLETLLNSTVDKNFDIFEIFVLRSILSVPAELASWMRLNHYEGITYPPPENAPTAEDVALLRRKLNASRNVSKTLALEYANNEAILTQLRALTAKTTEDGGHPNLSFLQDTTNAQGFSSQQPLTTNVSFTLSQLPALKSILTDLRAKLKTLKDLPVIIDTAKEEQREERRGYIEQRVRSHLDRTGQSSSKQSGPIHGKQMDRNEVEAMEKVAAMFNPP